MFANIKTATLYIGSNGWWVVGVRGSDALSIPLWFVTFRWGGTAFDVHLNDVQGCSIYGGNHLLTKYISFVPSFISTFWHCADWARVWQGTGRRNKADIITYSPTVPILSHCPVSPPTPASYWVSTGYLRDIYYLLGIYWISTGYLPGFYFVSLNLLCIYWVTTGYLLDWISTLDPLDIYSVSTGYLVCI